MSLRTLVATDREGTKIVGKHLLDETAEFKMPSLARHAAEDEAKDKDQRLEETLRWDPGFSRKPPVPGSQDTQQR